MSTMSIMFQFQGLLLIFILLKLTRCSMVLDKFNQNTIYVSTYCPKQKYCDEGTHVMCMYYDHENTIGQRCKNFVETEITAQLVQKILDVVNEIRSRLATGVERGKDGLVLPRAYGMMRMLWDSELATLAQVLANQCLGGREDLCRATDKFPNPSQSIAIVQFRFPDWEYVRMNSTAKGLTEEKLSFSVDRYLKSLHALRKTATAEIITNCPPLQELPDRHLRYYLNLIRGGATHIGCGLSAYTRYHDDGGRQSIRNSVQIVCNISDGPQPLQPVYSTDPPLPGDGYTEDCGCPPGHKESDGCLCEVDPDYMTTTTTEPPYYNLHSKFQFTKSKDTTLRNRWWMEKAESSERTERTERTQRTLRTERTQRTLRTERTPMAQRTERTERIESTERTERWTKIQLKAQSQSMVEAENPRNVGTAFTDDAMTNCEVKVVVLPILSIKDKPLGPVIDNELNSYNNTLGPRQRVIDKYDYSEESFNELPNDLTTRPDYKYNSRFTYKKKLPKKINSNISSEKPHYETESLIKLQKIFGAGAPGENQHSKQIYDSGDDTLHNNVTDKENDHKLLDLLNILEQEVKNIDLNGNLRLLFDSKMRKIYGTALNTPRERTQYGNNLRELKDFLRNKFVPIIGDDKLADKFEGSPKSDELETEDHNSAENDMRLSLINSIADRKYFGSVQPKVNNDVGKSLIYIPGHNTYNDHANNDQTNNVDYNSNKKLIDSDRHDPDHKYHEVGNAKSNAENHFSDNEYSDDTFALRAQENMAPYNNNDLIELNVLSSKEVKSKNLDKHDHKQGYDEDEETMLIEVNRRRLDDTKKLPDLYKQVTSLERILPYIESSGKRSKINTNFRRIFRHENMRPMRQMRPSLADVIRPRFPRHRHGMPLSDRDHY